MSISNETRVVHRLHRLHRFSKTLEKSYRDAAAIQGGDKSPDNYYNAACVFSIIGQRDKAFSYLEEAIRLGFRDVQLLETDKDLNALRGDPRWRRMLEMIFAKPQP